MTFHEDDLHAPAKDYQSAQIEIGTVGWEGRDEHAELGTEENDGHTLVCVTLYRGRTPGEPVKRGAAQGYKIRCHITEGVMRVPPKGARVLVAIPFGMDQLPGAAVIIGVIAPSSTRGQFDQDRVVLDFGDDTHVVIRGKSVSLQDSGSPANFVGVGTPKNGGDRGIYALSHVGSGLTVQGKTVGAFSVDNDGNLKSMMQLTDAEASFGLAGVGVVKFKSGECSIFAAEPLPVKAPMVLLGPAPSAVPNTSALLMVLGAPTPSATVFISP